MFDGMLKTLLGPDQHQEIMGMVDTAARQIADSNARLARIEEMITDLHEDTFPAREPTKLESHHATENRG